MPPVGNAKTSLCLPTGGWMASVKSCRVSHPPVLGMLSVPTSGPDTGSSSRTSIGPPSPPAAAVTVIEAIRSRSTGSQAM